MDFKTGTGFNIAALIIVAILACLYWHVVVMRRPYWRSAWLCCGLLCLQQAAGAQQATAPVVIPLYPAESTAALAAEGGEEKVRVTEQGEHVVSNVHRPSLTVYLPARAAGTAAGTAVIVVPGGGYRELWMDHEGHNVARFLNEHGIAAFVLKYRLPRAPGSRYTIMGDSLGDLLHAVRLVRSRGSRVVAGSASNRRTGFLGRWAISPVLAS